jgi:hypothetical protein
MRLRRRSAEQVHMQHVQETWPCRHAHQQFAEDRRDAKARAEVSDDLSGWQQNGN